MNNATTGPLLLFNAYNARSYGLSESGVTFKGDLNAITINPACLSSLDNTTITVFYLPWYENMTLFSMGLGFPLHIRDKLYGSVSLNLSSFSTGPFPNYDEFGNELPNLESNDLLITMAYGYPLPMQFDVGINFKYFNTKLGDKKSKSVAIDIGILKCFNVPGIRFKDIDHNLDIGVSVQNIGFSQEYIKEKSPLPFKIRAGANYLFYAHNKINTSLITELIQARGYQTKLCVGTEIFLLNYYNLRIGYKLIGDVLHKYSYGIGIYENRKGYNLIIDYSYIPLIEVGAQHAFSVKLEFKSIPAEQTNQTNIIH